MHHTYYNGITQLLSDDTKILHESNITLQGFKESERNRYDNDSETDDGD